jgi:hypothetical protein
MAKGMVWDCLVSAWKQHQGPSDSLFVVLRLGLDQHSQGSVLPTLGRLPTSVEVPAGSWPPSRHSEKNPNQVSHFWSIL